MSTSYIDEIVNFRTRLIEERKRLGYTNQTDFAHQIGISGKTYNHYETGKSTPGLTELMQMGGKGADLCYLMTGRRIPLHEQSSKVHGQHVLGLVDTVVAAQLDEEDVDILIALVRKLGG